MMKTGNQKNNVDLHLPHNITRRDFIGTALIGTGTALLAAKAPGLLTHAHAQTSRPYELVGPDWSGPGGIGDYADANGNTHEVMNAAHSLRDGYWTDPAAKVQETGEEYDLVVVGGGFAGLMSAYEYLKHRDGKGRVLILDNHAIFGGEAKQNEVEVDGYHLHAPQGSNMCLWPAKDWKTSQFFYHPIWEEIGMPMGDERDVPTWLNEATGTDKDLFFPREDYMHMMVTRHTALQAYFYGDPDSPGGLNWVMNPWENNYKDLDWPEEVKQELAHLDRFPLDHSREDFDEWMDSMSYKEYLTDVVGITRQEVFDYLSPMIAAYGTGLGCDAISALSAAAFSSPGTRSKEETEESIIFEGDRSEIEPFGVSFPGGNTVIARHFVKRMLPDAIEGKENFKDILYGKVNWEALDRDDQNLRMRMNSTVIDVRHDGPADDAGKVLVSYLNNKSGEVHRVTGKTVIMAGGQWMNKHVVRDLPGEIRTAMDTFQHAPILTVNVALRHWRFMEKLGITSARWFGERSWYTCIRAPMSLDGEHMPLDPNKPIILTFYIPFTRGVSDQGIPYQAQGILARTQLFTMTYREIETTIRKQLTAMFGKHGFDHERDIAAIIANRWGHAYIIPQPGFFHGVDGKEPARDVIRRGYGRIRFAHSELTGDQLWSNACYEGERAAKQVVELIHA